MNLRQTLLWKILLGASCISIVYYSYKLYGYYGRNQSSWTDYSNEKAEMEKNEFDNESPFFKMIEDLEKKLQNKSANIFTFENNPADLRRIIELEGMENYYGVGTNDIILMSVLGGFTDRKAYVQYNGGHYELMVGDTIDGGIITEINPQNFTLLKDTEGKLIEMGK